MPRGISNRDFVTLAAVDSERLFMFSKSVGGDAFAQAVNKAVPTEAAGFVRGEAMCYGCFISKDDAGECALTWFEHLDPCGTFRQSLSTGPRRQIQS